uniref:Uncharacterized protein n=1 Tax=Utricularia reniformis TaxID=192314 RepID=A0A1Y0B272_9LAMI|nr:hypothetical protein AEK19_MT1347 [Utricularia reniformis]ART31546.1 hypothetical protein AEK19_MT1347 [Utricularia reniformis]
MLEKRALLRPKELGRIINNNSWNSMHQGSKATIEVDEGNKGPQKERGGKCHGGRPSPMSNWIFKKGNLLLNRLLIEYEQDIKIRVNNCFTSFLPYRPLVGEISLPLSYHC